jgi:hypothetical protein
MENVEIVQVETDEELEDVRTLFREYEEYLKTRSSRMCLPTLGRRVSRRLSRRDCQSTGLLRASEWLSIDCKVRDKGGRMRSVEGFGSQGV